MSPCLKDGFTLATSIVHGTTRIAKHLFNEVGKIFSITGEEYLGISFLISTCEQDLAISFLVSSRQVLFLLHAYLYMLGPLSHDFAHIIQAQFYYNYLPVFSHLAEVLKKRFSIRCFETWLVTIFLILKT